MSISKALIGITCQTILMNYLNVVSYRSFWNQQESKFTLNIIKFQCKETYKQERMHMTRKFFLFYKV